MAAVWTAVLKLAPLLLLLTGHYDTDAFPFGPTHIDWSSFTCNQLDYYNTDELHGCRYIIANAEEEEIICKLVAKQEGSDAIVIAYRKVLVLTITFHILPNTSNPEENVICASLVSLHMEIRTDTISDAHTVGDLPENFISFLYFVMDGSHITIQFTNEVPLATVKVNHDCDDNARKKREATHCIEEVRFMKEIKRGAYHLKFPTDEFWNFIKRRFIAELGGEMTQLKLVSSGKLSAISLRFFTRLISSDLRMKELTLAGLKVGNLDEALVTMPTLATLRLPDNGITALSEGVLLAVPNILQLDVAGNELQDLPPLPAELVTLNVSRNRLVTLPVKLPHALSILNISYNAIEVLHESLPAALLVLDASHNDLQKLPEELPADLNQLDVSHNRLQTLFMKLPSKLEVLRIAHNQLKTVDANMLVNLNHLQLLDLSHNELTSVEGVWLSHQLSQFNVSHNALRHLRLLGPGSILHVDASENDIESWEVTADRLTLVGNARAALGLQQHSATSRAAAVDLGDDLQLDCDPCSAHRVVALQLRRWLLRQEKNESLGGPRVVRPARPLCSEPPAQRDRSLLVAAGLEDRSGCPGSPRRVAQLVLLAVAALALVVGVAVFCHYRRYEITYVIHLMKMRRERLAAERRNPASYKYDAFVCYSSADRAWVVGTLLARLEQPGGSPEEPALRLCLHERNFPLGSLIADNIMASMRTSRSTVVVLSQAFVDSQWCRWELELASSKVTQLVLVELERLDRAHLPRHLRYLMDTRTYLEWPAQPRLQAAMWRRLRAALATPAAAAAGSEAGDLGLADGDKQSSRADMKA